MALPLSGRLQQTLMISWIYAALLRGWLVEYGQYTRSWQIPIARSNLLDILGMAPLWTILVSLHTLLIS